MSAKHFLSLLDLSASEAHGLVQRAIELKTERRGGILSERLRGTTLAMVFEKSSTRTKLSFEIAMRELGGQVVHLGANSQVARGEPMQDTARVLSGYCHGIVMRTFGQERLETLAKHSSIPVINALTDLYHPCQLLADMQTMSEVFGDISGLRCAWIGDGNNMAHSWIHAAAHFGLHLRLACPEGYDPERSILHAAQERCRQAGAGSIEVFREPEEAATEAAVISTDVWASMGQEEEAKARQRAFEGFQVNQSLMARARPEAVVLHCLPAHREEEITEEVLEGPQSRVWQQAENRLHAQKALLERFIEPLC